MTVLLGCMIAVYLSGLCAADIGKSLKTESGGLSRKAGVYGLLRKGLMLLVVLVAAMLGKAIGSEPSMFRDAVCWLYVAIEGTSLMENLNLASVIT